MVIIYTITQTTHETEIKMVDIVEIAEMVEIISTWTLPKVEMAEITLYYVISVV